MGKLKNYLYGAMHKLRDTRVLEKHFNFLQNLIFKERSKIRRFAFCSENGENSSIYEPVLGSVAQQEIGGKIYFL